jgi:hypothetical protein
MEWIKLWDFFPWPQYRRLFYLVTHFFAVYREWLIDLYLICRAFDSSVLLWRTICLSQGFILHKTQKTADMDRWGKITLMSAVQAAHGFSDRTVNLLLYLGNISIVILSVMTPYSFVGMSRDSAVGIETAYRLGGRRVGVRAEVQTRFFSFPRHPDRLWDPSNLLFNGCRGQSSRGVKLTNHLNLRPRSRIHGSTHPLPS